MIAILCLIAVFVATYFVVKTAKDTGRNAVLWGLLTLAVGLGFQLFIPLLVGIVVGVALIATGTPADQVQEALGGGLAALFGIVSIFLSFIGIWLIMRQVSKIPDEAAVFPVSVPPPPTF